MAALYLPSGTMKHNANARSLAWLDPNTDPAACCSSPQFCVSPPQYVFTTPVIDMQARPTGHHGHLLHDIPHDTAVTYHSPNRPVVVPHFVSMLVGLLSSDKCHGPPLCQIPAGLSHQCGVVTTANKSNAMTIPRPRVETS